MARRASSSSHPLWTIIAIVLLAAAIGGGWYVYQIVGDPYRTLTPLAVDAYLENSATLRGNVYKITGTVGNKLAWAAGTGSLFAVDVETDSRAEPLPVLVPSRLDSVNVQKGQRFHFRVEVDQHGILVVRDLQKS